MKSIYCVILCSVSILCIASCSENSHDDHHKTFVPKDNADLSMDISNHNSKTSENSNNSSSIIKDSRVHKYINEYDKAFNGPAVWSNMPYCRRVTLALARMNSIPLEKREPFANWHMWNDPRVGCILYSNLACHAQSTPNALLMHSRAAGCVAASENYEYAWKYCKQFLLPVAQKNYLSSLKHARIYKIIADIAQHRNDKENAVRHAKLYYEAILSCNKKQLDNRDIKNGIERYAVALFNANKYKELQTFMNRSSETHNINVPGFLDILQTKLDRLRNPNYKVSFGKIRTVSWPEKNDTSPWKY